MFRKKHAFLSFLLLAAVLRLPANGGPAQSSSIYSSGNLRLDTMEDIRLKREVITVKPMGDVAEVSVEYLFINSGPERVLTYGFPVTFSNIQWDTHDPFWQEEELPLFEMRDENGPLAHRGRTDPDSAEIASGGSLLKGHTRWQLAELRFPAEAEKRLWVRYVIKVQYEDLWSSSRQIDSYSERLFEYNLYPSSKWGDGRVEEFRLVIDLGGLRAAGAEEILLPFGLEAEGRERVEFSAAGFSLVENPFFRIRYRTDGAKLYNHFEAYGAKKEDISFIEASSTLPSSGRWRYEAANLIDGDPSTAWVEGVPGPGVGESIRVGLDGFDTAVVGIVNGFHDSEKTWRENARIRRVLVELLLEDGSAESFEVELADRPYKPTVPRAWGDKADILFDAGDAVRPAKEIRLTILETWKGTKYEDTCISELLIAGWSRK